MRANVQLIIIPERCGRIKEGGDLLVGSKILGVGEFPLTPEMRR